VLILRNSSPEITEISRMIMFRGSACECKDLFYTLTSLQIKVTRCQIRGAWRPQTMANYAVSENPAHFFQTCMCRTDKMQYLVGNRCVAIRLEKMSIGCCS
jgi:hypothetical protein